MWTYIQRIVCNYYISMTVTQILSQILLHLAGDFSVIFHCNLNGIQIGPIRPQWGLTRSLPPLPPHSGTRVFFQILSHPEIFPTTSSWLCSFFLSLFFSRPTCHLSQVWNGMSSTRPFPFSLLVALHLFFQCFHNTYLTELQSLEF